MIRLSVMNQKGGVGKSMLSAQFAFYCALKLDLRVLFVDLDQQGNSSKTLAKSGCAAVSQTTSGRLLSQAKPIEEQAQFLLIGADRLLSRLESEGTTKHKTFIQNFYSSMQKVSDDFDICIYDTSPTPDIRALSALACSDYVVSPVELNQEAIDGVQALYENIQRVKEINHSLKFLGLVPNRVMSTPFQKDNLRSLILHYGQILLKDSSGKSVFIPNRTSIGEAQSECRPLWLGAKSTSEKAFREIKKVFDALSDAMHLQSEKTIEVKKEE